MIASRFQPLETVRGGFPIKARDLQTGQTVVLNAVDDLDERLVGIFHPSLLAIFVIVNHEGRRIAACEFVPARTLTDVFAGEPCHPNRAMQIVSEVADAIAELHGRGIAHGRISTSSVHLTLKGKAKLSLNTAVASADQQRDVQALRTLLETIAGRPFPTIDHTSSAAVLAAILREP